MKIKFPNAEKFIAENKTKFIGRRIASYDTEYEITDVIFDESEVLAVLKLNSGQPNGLKLTMDISRAAELCELSFDWKACGFKAGKKDNQ